MRFIKNYLLFFILLTTHLSISQNQEDWAKILESSISHEKKVAKIDSIITALQVKKNDSVLERLTHKYAIWFYINKKIDKAIETATYSLSIKKRSFKTDTSLLQNGLKNLAFFHFKNKDYVKSIDLYQELLRLNSLNNYATGAYIELGRCYSATGDYYNAILHFELAQSLLEKGKNFKQLIANAINSSEAYIRLEKIEGFKKAIQNLVIADSLSDIINSRNTTKYTIKQNLGNLYNQDKFINPEKALYYYNDALKLAKETNDSTKIATAYGLIGNLYSALDPNTGIKYQEKAMLYTNKKDSVQYYFNYINIAYCLAQNKNFKESIKYYYKAINFLTGSEFGEDTLKFDTQMLYNSTFRANLLNGLKDLANTYLLQFKASKKKEALVNAINAFVLADKFMDLIRIESQEFQSKLYWRKQSSDLYGKAIEACYLANDTNNAFYFMEKNKALLLSEDINNSKIRQSLQLPGELVDKETSIKKNIYILEKNKADTEESKDSIAIALLNQKRQLQKLQDSLQRVFPKYNPFNLRAIIALKDRQQQLDDQTIIFEYNISEHKDFGLISKNSEYTPIYQGSDYGARTTTNAYVLCITKDSLQLVEIPKASEVKDKITTLVRQVSTPFRTKEDISSFKKQAYDVFNILFPTQKIREQIKNKNIIIAPDNYLNYLPFETLITGLSPNSIPNYLIKDCQISYVYSNSFLESTRDSRPSDKNSFLGFAPQDFDTSEMISLPNSVQEVTNIKDSFAGKLYTNASATKDNFVKALPHHNIIHLATHANALDSISPWIAFRNQKLHLEELYFTKNNADLVVLSGCNTLKGKQATGEGVMSLARGFFHSGAKSVVSSLWNVDDRSTTYIMDHFYKNLKKGQSKSEALRNAKLNYLKNHSLSQSSPHFWAAFTLSGNTDPLLVSNTILSSYWLFLLVFFPILIVVYLKNKK